MIAVVTYKFLGETRVIHCSDKEGYLNVLMDVGILVDNGWVKDYHAYECVEIEGAFD